MIVKTPFVNGILYHGNDAAMGLTFALSGTLEVGDAVNISAPGTVTRAADGAPFIGFLASREADNFGATKELHRIVQAKCAAALAPGRQSLVGDGNGGVKAGANGTICVVVNKYVYDGVDYASLYIA